MLVSYREILYKKRTVVRIGCAGGIDFKGRKQDLAIGKHRARISGGRRTVRGDLVRAVREIRACQPGGFIPP